MSDKPIVIVDPSFRKMAEIFSPGALERLHQLVEVVWGRDEPMPLDKVQEVLPQALGIVCANWRYGAIPPTATHLRAILTVSGGFPQNLDYDYCFAHHIRVLSAAPAFGPQVAEMALGMALAACREIVAGDRAMRDGQEKWLHAGNL